MNEVVILEIKSVDRKLVRMIERLERRNLGREASINQWVIPVIIRYGKFIVAQKSGNDSNIIGVCELIRSWKSENSAFIHSFYVDKGYRGKGIGQKLLQEVISNLKNDGFREIELTVDPGNKAANRLYKKFGFKRIDFRKNEYGRGVNRDLMRLEL
ncbi:MAG TPA: GNAT family N-acetyltransferase [Candidatus Hydromicrobium sp.]